MNFRILHEFPAPDLEIAWRDCLSRVECPAHYDAPEFFREPYWTGKRPFAVLALDGVTVTGVLTGLHESGHVLSGLASRPQICVDRTKETRPILEALLQGLRQEAKSASMILVYTWPSLELPAFAAGGFRKRPLAGNVVLDLSQGAEALFKQFPKDRRRNIRFAEKNGVTISPADSPADIAEAYEIYRQWRKTDRKEVKGEERAFEVFEKAAQLTGNRLVLLARLSGRVIAINIFRFYPGGLFESAANHSLEEFLHLKPNELLQWKGIEWACNHGLRRHSLGGSHEFLRRFGGTIVPILRYRLDRTLLRRHDVREALRDLGRATLRRLPGDAGTKVRRLLNKD
jgi:hypothetical protein